MTFVNPLLLAGAALVVLPVVLHLIMRRKPTLLEFPALRLVQRRHDTNQRRLRLRHLLLLLLRVAAIALLAFALSRPSVKFGDALGSQEAPVAAVLLADASPRMAYRHENQTRLEAARDLGLWLLAQFPAESQIAVLDTRPGSAAFQVDRGAARQRLERLEVVANSQPLTTAVDEALRLVAQSEMERKEIYIFSDLARGAWADDASAARLRERIGQTPGVGLYVIDVGVENPLNFSLGDLQISGQVLAKGSPLEIRTEIGRSGPEEKREVELHLLDNQGQAHKRSGETFTVTPGASQQVNFRVDVLDLGTHQGLVRIAGQDGLAADDVRYFTVEVRPAWRILVVGPKPAPQNTLFFTEALAPTLFRKLGQARFDCDVIAFEELAQRPLRDYASVCLLDPVSLEPAVWQKLGNYAAEGHGVGIFLGRNAANIESFNASLAQEVLPAKLIQQARRPDGDCALAPQQYQHPVLAPFHSMAGSIPWNAFPVMRYWQLDTLASGVGVILPYSDGRPALLERTIGRGRVLTMTTPLSEPPNRDAWNLLPVGEAWPYLILTNQIALYLVGSSEEQLNYYAGQTAVLHLAPESQQSTYLLTAPGDVKFPLSADLGRHMLAITATDQAGNYRVRAGGRESGFDRGFSVNFIPEQTRLDRISQEELSKIFGPAPYRTARTRDQINRDVALGRVGRELFPGLIAALAIVLALEHLVANRFYRE